MILETSCVLMTFCMSVDFLAIDRSNLPASRPYSRTQRLACIMCIGVYATLILFTCVVLVVFNLSVGFCNRVWKLFDRFILKVIGSLID